MFRLISAVLLGYFVMAVLVMASFLPAMKYPQFAFAPDSLEPGIAFLCFALGMSLIAALAGGYAAAWRGGRRAANVLLLLILVLGLGMAASNARRPRPNVPKEKIASMTMRERMENSVQPTWYSFVIPFVGAVGAFVGGRLRTRGRPSAG